mmetsp:Transcript_21498/g.51293  ORF Transcript_21498/g.51293 Transcript_21498/m.51293 type:complete len:222 (+) Transcript_21498:658-1323(+)
MIADDRLARPSSADHRTVRSALPLPLPLLASDSRVVVPRSVPIRIIAESPRSETETTATESPSPPKASPTRSRAAPESALRTSTDRSRGVARTIPRDGATATAEFAPPPSAASGFHDDPSYRKASMVASASASSDALPDRSTTEGSAVGSTLTAASQEPFQSFAGTMLLEPPFTEWATAPEVVTAQKWTSPPAVAKDRTESATMFFARCIPALGLKSPPGA